VRECNTPDVSCCMLAERQHQRMDAADSTCRERRCPCIQLVSLVPMNLPENITRLLVAFLFARGVTKV
jgi:hypothetical protein